MDEDEPPFVPVRPYSADLADADRIRSTQAKKFRPTPPSERRSVDQVMFSSVHSEEDARAVLMGGLRRQDALARAAVGEAVIPERFRGMSLRKFGVSGTPGSASGSIQPRKMKKKQEGKSMNLMELAFRGTRKTAYGEREFYAPISLPYFDVQEDEVGESAEMADPRKTARPAIIHVDEANANAAKELFLTADGHLQEENYFLIQLPFVLPEPTDPEDIVVREQEDANTAGVGASITRLPDGLIGKMHVHESGKVRMDIGGLPFCVDKGCESFFQQDLVCVCPLAEEVIDLGPIQKRAILTPDIDMILSEMLEASAGISKPNLEGAGSVDSSS